MVTSLRQVNFIGMLLSVATNLRGFLTLIRVKEAVVSRFPFEMVRDDLCYTDTSKMFIIALIQNETSQLNHRNYYPQNNMSCSL